MNKKLRNSFRFPLLGTMLLLLFAGWISQPLSAQQKHADSDFIYIPSADLDVAPGVQVRPHFGNNPQAMWDVEFQYNIENATNAGAWAGMVWTGTEFWTSIWNSDTLARFDVSGNLISIFTIPGVSGIRSMTTDGTNIYAGNASTTINIIDPATRMSTGTITSPEDARHCTYDPTANGGAGGLWVGNWATDIYQISLTGATLNTISAASHGLTAMYGSAFDNVSVGGPYLWIFDQSGTASQAEIVQLSLPGGTPTGLKWDVMRDVGSTSLDGLAGGLCITNQIIPGKWTLAGLLQGTPDDFIFGYELDSAGPKVDIQLDGTFADNGYTQIPIPQVSSITFSGDIVNNGTETINTFNYDIEVFTGGSSVFTDQQSANNLQPWASGTLSSAPYTPSASGMYTVTSNVSVMSPQVDSINANDSINISFEITDTTYARDDGISDGSQGYAASNTEWAYAAALWDINVQDTLTSVTIEIETPITGDTTYAVVAEATGGVPGAILALGPPVIINDPQDVYVLPLPGGVVLPAGQYAIGCYEGANTTINLRQSNNIFVQDMNFFYLPNQGWFFSSRPTARFIRPNFGTIGAVGIEEVALLDGTVKVYPNPGEGEFFLEVELEQSAEFQIQVTNLMGQSVWENTVHFQQKDRTALDLRGQAPGVYFVNMTNGKEAITKKIVLQ